MNTHVTIRTLTLALAALAVADLATAQTFLQEISTTGYRHQHSVTRELPDGSQVTAGRSLDANSNRFGMLMRTRYRGNAISYNNDVLWQAFYGAVGPEDFRDARASADGEILAAGSTVGQPWIVKVQSATGFLIWQKRLDLPGEFHAVTALPDGSAAAGNTDSGDFLIARFDTSGVLQWMGTYGWPGSIEEAYSIQAHPAGGLLVAGYTTQFETTGSGNLWVLRLDDQGQVLWANSIGNPTETEGLRAAIDVTPTGDAFLVSGLNLFGPLQDDAIVASLDANGVVQWARSLDLALDETRGVAATDDGGCIVFSNTSPLGALQDLWLSRLDAAGQVLWDVVITSNQSLFGTDVDTTAHGGILVSGTTNAGGTGLVLVNRLESDGSAASASCNKLATVTSVSASAVLGEDRTLPPVTLSTPQAVTTLAARSNASGFQSATACIGCRVNMREFGQGTPGSGGFVPLLSGTEGLCNVNGNRDLDLTGGLGGGFGILFISTGTLNLPLYGGTLYVDITPPRLLLNLFLGGVPGVPGAGSWHLDSDQELRSLTGTEIYFQALMADPGAARGVSLTNALEWVIGN